MNKEEIIKRLRQFPAVKGKDIPVGVVSSLGKGAVIDESNGNNDIIAIANTADIDLDDEIVVPSGLDTKYFEANRQVFLDHEYDVANAAGFLRSIKRYPSPQDHKSWKVRIGLYPNAAGNAVKAIVKASGQIGLSIGFFPIDVGPPTEAERKEHGDKLVSIVRSGRWFELSFTALPCNVSCQGRFASSGDGKVLTVLGELVKSGEVDQRTATLLGMPAAKEYMVLTPGGIIIKSVDCI